MMLEEKCDVRSVSKAPSVPPHPQIFKDTIILVILIIITIITISIIITVGIIVIVIFIFIVVVRI